MAESDLVRVRSVDVARLFGAGAEDDGAVSDAIVFEIASPEEAEDTFLFWMYDVEAYAFIRKLTDVLFDADPPRSGVGSLGATAE